ncbi:MAG TPA: sugar ABC transporter permease [Chloroflexota bacterium]
MAVSPSPNPTSELVVTTAVRPQRRGISLGSHKNGWVFVIPAVLVLLLLNIFPLIYSIALSFSNVSTDNGLSFGTATLDNWRILLNDSSFWDSLKFTILFVVLAVTIEYFIGFGLALLLWRPIRFGGFFRVLFSIPMMLAPVAIGFMFRMIYDQSNGPVDGVLQGIGVNQVPWLAESKWAVASVIIMDVWEWTPLLFLLLLAGLQALPEDAIEAAQLDGASGLRIVTSVIFPILAPISVMVVFLRMVDAFTIFGQIFLLTGGGPGSATTSTTLFAFFQGFQNFNVSYGATIALALLVIVTAVALSYLAVARLLMRRIEA